jgi:CRP/FNR family cyclic AMP-dependent transcriptional regulator
MGRRNSGTASIQARFQGKHADWKRTMAAKANKEDKMRIGEPHSANRQSSPAPGFISALSAEAAKEFERITVTTTYPAGAVLFVEGETPRGVFVLSRGRAKLSIGSASGKVMILRIAKAGEILGLHAVVSGTPFQATAQTVEPCQVSFVRSDEFLRLLRDYPQASLEAARQLSSSYQEACEQLRSIGLCDSAKKKVARFVLEWAESGEKRKDGIHATLTLTHEEIGQLIGTSRETITRALGEFRARRWILIKGSTLLIQNVDALQSLVGFDGASSWASEVTQDGPRPYMNPRSFAVHAEGLR